MVGVVVGDQDVADALALNRRQDRAKVLGQVRAGIDDSDLAAANYIGSGAQISERPWIVGDHPADERRDLFDAAIFEFELSDVRDHGGSMAHSKSRNQATRGRSAGGMGYSPILSGRAQARA